MVPLLNVSVANHATNDSSLVTTVQFSEDGQDWYAVPYTGEPCDWVLGGESGHKTLQVRFGAQDGSVSPVVRTGITVDTAGPVTAAASVTRATAGRRAFRFVVRDAGSPRVYATIVVRGHGATRRYDLGRVPTGTGKAVLRLRLPSGSYSWRVEAVDLAGWEQERQAPGAFMLEVTRGRRAGDAPRGPLKSPLVHGRRPRTPPIAASGGGCLRARDRQERLVDPLVAGGREVGRQLAQQVREVRLRGADLVQRLPGGAGARRRLRRAPRAAP